MPAITSLVPRSPLANMPAADAADSQIWRRAIDAIARVAARESEDVFRPVGRPRCRRRRVAVYLSTVGGELPKTRVARIAGLSRRAVQKIVATVEDARDDAAFDALLTSLEQEIAA